MFHQMDKIWKGQFLSNPENFPPNPVNLIAKFIHDSFKTARKCEQQQNQLKQYLKNMY